MDAVKAREEVEVSQQPLVAEFAWPPHLLIQSLVAACLFTGKGGRWRIGAAEMASVEGVLQGRTAELVLRHRLQQAVAVFNPSLGGEQWGGEHQATHARRVVQSEGCDHTAAPGVAQKRRSLESQCLHQCQRLNCEAIQAHLLLTELCRGSMGAELVVKDHRALIG